eukprot:310999-Hanusia_phi.AAC.2
MSAGASRTVRYTLHRHSDCGLAGRTRELQARLELTFGSSAEPRRGPTLRRTSRRGDSTRFNGLCLKQRAARRRRLTESQSQPALLKQLIGLSEPLNY